MPRRILAFLKRPTSKDIIINTIGNYIGVVFTALFALILVRILNPAQYGVLSVLLGISYVLANVLDFGTTATIFSFLPSMLEKHYKGDRKTSESMYRFVKSMFFYQTVFSCVIIIAMIVSFPFLDKNFFKTGAPIIELYLTCISVLFFIWQNFISNILFAAKRFLKVNVYQNIANLLKTIILFILVFTHTVSVGSIIFVFGIVGPAIFFLMLFIEKKDVVLVLAKSEVKREEFRLGFTLTYFVASQFFNLGLRMDLFLLSYFRSKAEVGFYGLSQKIILTIIATVVSITQVLSPGFAKITTKKETRQQLKVGLMYMLLPCVLFILLMLIPIQIFQLFFTNKFVLTAPITKSLSLPFIIYALGSIPQLFILYTIKKPKYILYANIIFFIILTGGCYVLIPKIGVHGPPYAIAIALLVSTIMLIFNSIHEYKKLPA
ncbi:MAG: oligosaccharide flippase family protein [bacterium]|nr:oligosaccharide flippase family protein [bacterium]